MSGHSLAIGCLLTVATLVAIVSTLGVWLAPDALHRLHYLAPVAVVTTVLVAAAVVVAEAFDSRALKSLLLVVILASCNAILVHQTARVARVRREHDLR